jgi:hypothetical protein
MKTWKDFSQGSRCPEQKWNLAHAKYKSEALLGSSCAVLKVKREFLNKMCKPSGFKIFAECRQFTN